MNLILAPIKILFSTLVSKSFSVLVRQLEDHEIHIGYWVKTLV
jgi:hypothetical protein